MDWLTTLRIIVLLASFVVFLAIIFWAYHPRRKTHYDVAAHDILEEDDSNASSKRD